MSLDKNLFTLVFTPHKDNANVIDLVDPNSGTVHYRKQRVLGAEYKIEVYDPTSESLLATATGANAQAKTKSIELNNPTIVVELKHTGTLSFKWGFKWEEHDFEWKREECFMLRKPDPPVIIAVTKEPAGRLKTTTVQMLDYNLNRFDIEDRKGLEIVILTALLTFSDANDAYHSSEGPSASTPIAASSANPLSRAASAVAGMTSPISAGANDIPPPLPSKPAPRTGMDRIAEMQAMKGEYNEIIISDEGSVGDYAAYCNRLLQDDAMLFISVKSAEAEQVPKVLQVVEETKRIRYKAGLDEDDLHQYVLYDQKEQKKGPRIINLDDNRKNKYAPPENLTVHLSKIDMPELQPKPSVHDKHHKSSDSKSKSKSKDDKKAPSSSSKPSRPAPDAPAPSKANKVSKPPKSSAKTNVPPPPSASTPPPGKSGKLFQRSKNQTPPPKESGPPPKHQHILPHQVHPYQPSPSPSQLNNPGIYTAPPPPPVQRPTSYYGSGPSSSSGPSFPQPWGGGPPSGQSLYGSHAPHSGSSSFPPAGWTGQAPGPPPPPPPPPPVSGTSTGGKGASNVATIAQGASTMVHGLMGLIGSRHK